MSHVVPDLVQKVIKGQDPLHILGDGTQIRHYTYGGDLAEGIVTAMEHPAALNEDFNLSTDESTTVLELAEAIWTAIKGPDVPFHWTSDPPFRHDVSRRVPSTEKAKRLLGFEATTSLEKLLQDVIPWIETGSHRRHDLTTGSGQPGGPLSFFRCREADRQRRPAVAVRRSGLRPGSFTWHMHDARSPVCFRHEPR